MFDAMNNPISVGDTVIVGASGDGAAKLLFARVKAIGPRRVTLERLEGHPNTIPSWLTRSTRNHSDVLVVKL